MTLSRVVKTPETESRVVVSHQCWGERSKGAGSIGIVSVLPCEKVLEIYLVTVGIDLTLLKCPVKN